MAEVQRVHEPVERAPDRGRGAELGVAAEEGAARAVVDIGDVLDAAGARIVPDVDPRVGAAVVGDADVGRGRAGAGDGVGDDVVEARERRRAGVLGDRRLVEGLEHPLLVAAEGGERDERQADRAREAEERAGEGEDEGEGDAPARGEDVAVARRDEAAARALGDEEVADQVAVHEHAGDDRGHHRQAEDAGDDQAPGARQVELDVEVDEEAPQRALLVVRRLLPDEAVVALVDRAAAAVDAEDGAVVLLDAARRIERVVMEGDDEIPALAAPEADVVEVGGIDLAGQPADGAVDRALERRRVARTCPPTTGRSRPRRPRRRRWRSPHKAAGRGRPPTSRGPWSDA